MKESNLLDTFNSATVANTYYTDYIIQSPVKGDAEALARLSHDLVDDIASSQLAGEKPGIRADNAHWLSTNDVKYPHLKPQALVKK